MESIKFGRIQRFMQLEGKRAEQAAPTARFDLSKTSELGADIWQGLGSCPTLPLVSKQCSKASQQPSSAKSCDNSGSSSPTLSISPNMAHMHQQQSRSSAEPYAIKPMSLTIKQSSVWAISLVYDIKRVFNDTSEPFFLHQRQEPRVGNNVVTYVDCVGFVTKARYRPSTRKTSSVGACRMDTIYEPRCHEMRCEWFKDRGMELEQAVQKLRAEHSPFLEKISDDHLKRLLMSLRNGPEEQQPSSDSPAIVTDSNTTVLFGSPTCSHSVLFGTPPFSIRTVA